MKGNSIIQILHIYLISYPCIKANNQSMVYFLSRQKIRWSQVIIIPWWIIPPHIIRCQLSYILLVSLNFTPRLSCSSFSGSLEPYYFRWCSSENYHRWSSSHNLQNTQSSHTFYSNKYLRYQHRLPYVVT